MTKKLLREISFKAKYTPVSMESQLHNWENRLLASEGSPSLCSLDQTSSEEFVHDLRLIYTGASEDAYADVCPINAVLNFSCEDPLSWDYDVESQCVRFHTDQHPLPQTHQLSWLEGILLVFLPKNWTLLDWRRYLPSVPQSTISESTSSRPLPVPYSKSRHPCWDHLKRACSVTAHQRHG